MAINPTPSPTFQPGEGKGATCLPGLLGAKAGEGGRDNRPGEASVLLPLLLEDGGEARSGNWSSDAQSIKPICRSFGLARRPGSDTRDKTHIRFLALCRGRAETFVLTASCNKRLAGLNSKLRSRGCPPPPQRKAFSRRVSLFSLASYPPEVFFSADCRRLLRSLSSLLISWRSALHSVRGHPPPPGTLNFPPSLGTF